MRRLFVDELNDLHVRFSEMGMMVNEAIYKSVKAFINHDKALAREVIHEDKHINEREVDLEKRSFELIALQQPVTTDLRVIVTVMIWSGWEIMPFQLLSLLFELKVKPGYRKSKLILPGWQTR